MFRDAAPLHVAAARGLIEITEFLIQHGADVNIVRLHCITHPLISSQQLTLNKIK